MNKLVLDSSTSEKLIDFAARTELFDERGRFVGMFLPADEYMRLVCAQAEHEFHTVTTEECRRDVQENGGYTAEEGRRLLDAVRQQWEARK